MIEKLRNQMRKEGKRVNSGATNTRIGIIDGYDPSHYAVKVRIQPENVLTGWIPLKSSWVGDQWGIFAGPSLGDIVDVEFQQGDPNAASVGEKYFSASVRSLPVPSGELWIVHASGSAIKMTNDGNITISAANKLILHGANQASFDAGGTGFVYKPSEIDTYTDGVTGSHNGPNPPEVPT